MVQDNDEVDENPDDILRAGPDVSVDSKQGSGSDFLFRVHWLAWKMLRMLRLTSVHMKSQSSLASEKSEDQPLEEEEDEGEDSDAP